MKRVLAFLFSLVLTACSTTGPSPDEFVTHWNVRPAIGLDALLLIGAASGDIMQAEHYPDEIAFVREHMSAEGLAAMEALDVALRQRLGRLTGPTLVHVFSAGESATLDDVIASAADPVGRLRPGLERSPHWNLAEFNAAVRMMPHVHTALIALRDIGFVERYEQDTLPLINAAIESDFAAIMVYDVIPEQSRLLGRELDPQIDIILAHFTIPYGIRLLDQQFISFYGWDADIQLRNAAHEIFHPPFDPYDDELMELLSALREDPWFTSIVEDHDPQFGYNSFMGVVNEDSTQALDQIVSDRLGFAREPGHRWRTSDGGMHMFAAALYHAMLETGFAESGGTYSEWLKDGLRSGLLSPSEVRRRAALVVGTEAVNAWGPHRATAREEGLPHAQSHEDDPGS